MTHKELVDMYEREAKQAGDTEKDFYEWAIAYLLKMINYKVQYY